MKPIKSLVLFLVVVAMFFAFSSCRKKADVPVNDVNIEESEYLFEDNGIDEPAGE